MQERVLQKLEFDKVIEQLVGCCTCSLGQEKAQVLAPSTSLTEIERWQQETSEAKELLRKEPLGRSAESGTFAPPCGKRMAGDFDPHELLEVVPPAASRLLKLFLTSGRGGFPGSIGSGLRVVSAIERGLRNVSAMKEKSKTRLPHPLSDPPAIAHSCRRGSRQLTAYCGRRSCKILAGVDYYDSRGPLRGVGETRIRHQFPVWCMTSRPAGYGVYRAFSSRADEQ